MVRQDQSSVLNGISIDGVFVDSNTANLDGKPVRHFILVHWVTIDQRLHRCMSIQKLCCIVHVQRKGAILILLIDDGSHMRSSEWAVDYIDYGEVSFIVGCGIWATAP